EILTLKENNQFRSSQLTPSAETLVASYTEITQIKIIRNKHLFSQKLTKQKRENWILKSRKLKSVALKILNRKVKLECEYQKRESWIC
ncbi:hypothetical protein, partial [Flavobacterium hankyongi]|uniref:hypothetical protein n=1 Tax=Flavobacterium hankyongi TaxID=1176532 RepID=UPI0031E9241F